MLCSVWGGCLFLAGYLCPESSSSGGSGGGVAPPFFCGLERCGLVVCQCICSLFLRVTVARRVWIRFQYRVAQDSVQDAKRRLGGGGV